MNSLRELERPAKCGGTPLNSEHLEESEKGRSLSSRKSNYVVRLCLKIKTKTPQTNQTKILKKTLTPNFFQSELMQEYNL